MYNYHLEAQEIKSILNRARMLFRTPKKELPADLEVSNTL